MLIVVIIQRAETVSIDSAPSGVTSTLYFPFQVDDVVTMVFYNNQDGTVRAMVKAGSSAWQIQDVTGSIYGAHQIYSDMNRSITSVWYGSDNTNVVTTEQILRSLAILS